MIVGWDPNEVKNNVEMVTVATQDASGVVNGGGITSEGVGTDGACYVLIYPHPPIGESNRPHTTIQYNRYIYMHMDMKQ